MTFILAEDTALKELLKGMTVSDNTQANRPVDVFFTLPDVEVKQQKYPYVTIDLIDIQAANYRQHAGYWVDTDYNGTIAPDEGVTYRYYTPVAYDLVYQVSSWSRHPYHDRAILNQVMRDRFPSKYGKLQISNELGTESAPRNMFLDEFAKMNYVEDGRRVYRNIFTVRITSEMTPAQADSITNRIVERVLINTITNHIPTNYDPV